MGAWTGSSRTTSRPKRPWRACRAARLLGRLDPREVEAMKQRPGKDMMVFGSGSIVSQLTQHSLIDEYQFVVCPIFLGSGRSLLSGVSTSVRLDPLETRKYPSGDVLLRYAPHR
jgi:dihydrofolate reductase